MKNYFKIVFLILIVFLVGCNIKNDTSTVDDTYYILDNYGILILCKETEQESYKKVIIQLKGNTDNLKLAVSELKQMEQSANIKNALGIAYLRLRQFEVSLDYFNKALEIAENEEEKASIVNNIVECENYLENNTEVSSNYSDTSLKDISDPVLKLVIKSNSLAEELNEKENFMKTIADAKKLLKEEKKLLGSNQFIGIFNYKTLATACYASDNMKKCDYYINQALKINQGIYQYKFVDSFLYSTYSFYFRYSDLKKSLDKQDICIKILEEFQGRDYYDLMRAYSLRGNIYFENDEVDKAIVDYQLILNRCSQDSMWVPIAYYNLGDAYNNPAESDKAVDFYAKAYWLWDQEGEEDLNIRIKENLENIYNRYISSDKEFDVWFQEQIQKAEYELKPL
ncbi:MAG: tetratricopeptide repeat protein [Hungatella sp.]|nr:tetratricopeptide repeat protein [Hungatella sp.]